MNRTVGARQSPCDIPFFGLARDYARNRDRYLAEIDTVLAAGHVLQGPLVSEFEDQVARATGREHAVAVGSGSDALVFALQSLGIGPGDRVAVTSLSFVASAMSIARSGATPVFMDTAPDSFQVSAACAHDVLPRDVAAIVVVPMFGEAPDFEAWEEVAEHRGVPIVEDAAQALGARSSGGRPAGSLGAASTLSFDPTKIIGAFGSGGAVVTDDPAIAAAVSRARYHGREPSTRVYEGIGGNSQLPTAAAAVLQLKLAGLSDEICRRTAVAHRFDAAIDQVDGLIAPYRQAGGSPNWHKYVVIAPGTRDVVRERLAERGVPTMIHYPVPLHRVPALANEFPPDLPIVESLVGNVLSLPIHGQLMESEVETIVEALDAVCAE